MTANAGVAQAMATDGAAVVRAVFPPDLYASFRSEVLAVVRQIDPAVHDGCGGDIDRAWQALTAKDRKLGGHVYDALKHSMTVRRFATSEALRGVLRDSLGSENLAVVDINFRIDAPSEDHFLFSWHQDYWFSICSPDAVVVWIPMMPLDELTGGVEYLPLGRTQGKIFQVRANPEYRSYSDSVLLDEEVDTEGAVRPGLSEGDALLFKFNVLHRSMPNRSMTRCRWTAQIRVASYDDPAFGREGFRPGVVTRDRIMYLERPGVTR